MNFNEAIHIAKKVNRYNELSDLYTRIFTDIEQLKLANDADNSVSITISTSTLDLTYTLSACSVVSFLRQIMRETDEQLVALYNDIKEW